MVVSLLALLILLAGCNSGGSSTSRGLVAFHNTTLGIWSTVTVDGRTITTDDGRFNVRFDTAGTYNYIIQSPLLGEYTGHAYFEPGKTTRLEIPPFPAWDPRVFNEIAI